MFSHIVVIMKLQPTQIPQTGKGSFTTDLLSIICEPSTGATAMNCTLAAFEGFIVGQ